jgi:hypothetical protein
MQHIRMLFDTVQNFCFNKIFASLKYGKLKIESSQNLQSSNQILLIISQAHRKNHL